MINLISMNCTSPKNGGPSLTASEIETYLPEITEWKVVEIDNVKQLTRQYKFSNFSAALKFTNQIGDLAEKEDHHPAILTEWGRVTVTWWTHAVNGLHLNDFISAAKTDHIYTG